MHAATGRVEEARAWLEPFGSHDTLYGMTAEAIAHLRPLANGITRIGILLGGAKLRRHFGPPAPAQGEVWADVALPWASSEELYAEAPLVLAMLARNNPVPLPVLGASDREWTAPWGTIPINTADSGTITVHADEWREALDALAGDIPNELQGNYLYDGISIGCTEDRRAATLTAMRQSSLTTVRIVPTAPIEGEWTQGFENDPDDPVNDFHEIAVPGRAVRAAMQIERQAGDARPTDASVVIRHLGREHIELILGKGIGVDSRAIKDKLTMDWRHLVPQTGSARTRCRIEPSELIRQVEAARKGPASSARDVAAIQMDPIRIHMLTADEAPSADAIRVRRTWLEGVAQAAAATRPGDCDVSYGGPGTTFAVEKGPIVWATMPEKHRDQTGGRTTTKQRRGASVC